MSAVAWRAYIGHEPVRPAGRYHFEPGQEMQHDTSPHDVQLGGKLRRVQTASLVLCHSRMLFFQHYPRFQRFDCKVFLTEALRRVRQALASGGLWMIVEPFAADRREENHNPIGRVFYSASTMICVPHSLSRRGPALGAQAGEERLRRIVTEVGFSRFRRATQAIFIARAARDVT